MLTLKFIGHFSGVSRTFLEEYVRPESMSVVTLGVYIILDIGPAVSVLLFWHVKFPVRVRFRVSMYWRHTWHLSDYALSCTVVQYDSSGKNTLVEITHCYTVSE